MAAYPVEVWCSDTWMVFIPVKDTTDVKVC